MSQGTEAVVLNYTPTSDEAKEDVQRLKKMAAAYFDAIVEMEGKYGPCRDFSLGKTKTQEASMWVTRGIFNPPEQIS